MFVENLLKSNNPIRFIITLTKTTDTLDGLFLLKIGTPSKNNPWKTWRNDDTRPRSLRKPTICLSLRMLLLYDYVWTIFRVHVRKLMENSWKLLKEEIKKRVFRLSNQRRCNFTASTSIVLTFIIIETFSRLEENTYLILSWSKQRAFSLK